jgi:hypothetical protein
MVGATSLAAAIMSDISASITTVSFLSGIQFISSTLRGAKVDTFSLDDGFVRKRPSARGSRNFGLGSPASRTIRAVAFFFFFCRNVFCFDFAESSICTGVLTIKSCAPRLTLIVSFDGLHV